MFNKCVSESFTQRIDGPWVFLFLLESPHQKKCSFLIPTMFSTTSNANHEIFLNVIYLQLRIVKGSSIILFWHLPKYCFWLRGLQRFSWKMDWNGSIVNSLPLVSVISVRLFRRYCEVEQQKWQEGNFSHVLMVGGNISHIFHLELHCIVKSSSGHKSHKK